MGIEPNAIVSIRLVGRDDKGLTRLIPALLSPERIPSLLPLSFANGTRLTSRGKKTTIAFHDAESDRLYEMCDPEKENLCLYGNPDGSWEVGLPAEEVRVKARWIWTNDPWTKRSEREREERRRASLERDGSADRIVSEQVPPELPEPVLGINFARDGMHRKDWLALVAVHSDCWLFSVAFFYGAKMDRTGREKLFKMINQNPTLYEMVTGGVPIKGGTSKKRKQVESNVANPPRAQAADTPLTSGRLLRTSDITPALVGRQAELFWPDDNLWYLVEIAKLDVEGKNATIQYTSGEIEDLDLMEIIENGHMSLLNQ